MADIGSIPATIVRTIAPSKTYRLLFDAMRIRGSADGLDALRQSIVCRLSTVKGESEIYSDDYGIPSADYAAMPQTLALVRVTDDITATLLKDDRILSVSDFEIDLSGEEVRAAFRVSTVYGETDVEGVKIDV